MAKKRSKTTGFDLGLSNKESAPLPSREEIESTVAKATNKDIQDIKSEAKAKKRRIPFTTAITPENRARLEAASHEGKGNVADLLNEALEHYFEEVNPLSDTSLVSLFLKVYQKKAKK